ncbi:MAG: endonuclease/exonuclease/phosphatase family protein [Dehalococcoidia bacterium]
MSNQTGFRIITFNLWNDPPSWPQRGPLTARQLAALAPEVVALQEVGVPDQQTEPLIAALAAATELPYQSAGCELHRPDGWSEGLAVLTSFSIEASDALAVEEWGNVCQWVRLRTPEGRALNLYNLHLNPHHDDLRHRQIAAIVDWTAVHPAADARLLCGDFNAIPQGSTVARVRQAGFRSAHAEHHGQEPARTFPTPLRPELYERASGVCLDYIWLSPSSLAVRDCRVALDQPDPENTVLYPSDHAGVVADLVWG